MAPTQRYAPLPNPQSNFDAEREMDDAFDDDDNDSHGETTPLTLHQPRSPVTAGRPPSCDDDDAPPVPNAYYDFERDYDQPPPGSPPSHSSLALPNNYGNSNGELPSSPVVRAPPQSIFRKTFGTLLPQTHQRIRDDRPRGSGTDNDGVFANVTAKPAPSVPVVTDSGDVHMMPEETQQEAPPVCYTFHSYAPRPPLMLSKSYVAASADAAPSYWDNTVHAPSGLDLNGDMLIDELPTGSVAAFVLTTLVSWFFQLPGFILTYLLHGSHAGRLGSQAGLALTLIQFGFGTTVMVSFPVPLPDDDTDRLGLLASGEPGPWGTGGANSTTDGGKAATVEDMRMAYAGHEWISFLLMTIGPSISIFVSLALTEFGHPYTPKNEYRLVPASHVHHRLLPCEALRNVRSRVPHRRTPCAHRRRHPARHGAPAEPRGSLRHQSPLRLGSCSPGADGGENFCGSGRTRDAAR